MMMPPIDVPCPPRNFVAEWTTMSAPCSIGRQQVGRRHGVIDHERHAGFVRDLRDGCDVEDVAAGVADRLGESSAVFGVIACGNFRVVRVVDEPDVDAELRERVVEQVVRAAVERGSKTMSRPAPELRMRRVCGRLAAEKRQSRPCRLRARLRAARTRPGRIHDPAVDVTELCRPKSAAACSVLLKVGRGLVDRDGARVGRGRTWRPRALAWSRRTRIRTQMSPGWNCGFSG